MKIAVIEEPKSCASCPLFDVGYAFDMCRLSKRQITTAESINVPKWCELKPMENYLEFSTVENVVYFQCSGIKGLAKTIMEDIKERE